LDPAALSPANYESLIKRTLRDIFPDVSGRRNKRALYGLVSISAGYDVRQAVLANPSMIGGTLTLKVPASDDVDLYAKGSDDRETTRLSPQQIAWADELRHTGRIDVQFNSRFFTSGDSREPELAGVWGAVVGSIYSLMVCLLLSFPVGVLAATYLEEFAPKNRWTDLIEVNINNLAAVPSIVFGLLGLAIFLNFMELPRSAPLVGGIVLAMMTLPTVIISARASLKAVPPSIREASLALGASPLETVFHNVVPLAMPGVLTGTIIGMGRALGETAPLLMIGMVAFVVDVPTGVTDPSTALPVQVYLWADSPERAFAEKTSAAILVLIGFLMCMNLSAVLLRKKFETKW
jgi:phosphate transport system permease protein